MFKIIIYLNLIFFISISSQAKSLTASTEAAKQAVSYYKFTVDDPAFNKQYNAYSGALLDLYEVTFDTALFNQTTNSKGKHFSASTHTLSGQRITLPLPDGSAVQLNVESSNMYLPDSEIVTYSGFVEGSKHHRFIFSVDKDSVYGEFKHDGLVYKFYSDDTKSTQHYLAILDNKYMPQDDDSYGESKTAMFKNTVNRSSAANVRVLFLYASNVSQPTQKISNILGNFNGVKAMSGVLSNRYISSAGTQMVNGTFSQFGLCKGTIITRMKLNLYEFVGLDAQMQAASADIAFLILNGPAGSSSCSIAGFSGHIGGQADGILDGPYALVADNYIGLAGDYSDVHELGHVFGGYHPQDGNAGTYNRGLIDTSDQNNMWQTMMGSYQTTAEGPCVFTGPIVQTCERIPYFSNPSKTYNGNPMGSSSSNMTAYLNFGMNVVSNYAPDPVPPPPAPANFTVTSEECWGLNNLSWSPVSGATSYQVFRSTHPFFYSPSQIYSGTLTQTNINVPSGTWYLRVKACNASGCGGFSPIKSATRVSYCQ
ncbi:hypothetical protein [Marinicella sp. W31]|uniref:hypothetical protein n=1 Tax=Marinicella sp. W31 TaxID=3023713 RepID=UPI003757D4A7